MNIIKKTNIVAFLLAALVVYVAFLQCELNALSKRIGGIEHSTVVTYKPLMPSSAFLEEDTISGIYSRLSAVEEKVVLLQKKSRVAVKSTEKEVVNEQEFEQRVFLEGREQWQIDNMDSLYVASEKKAQLMVEHLKNKSIEENIQLQVFSILREHFVEVAYVIADTQAYPTLEEFTGQIEILNEAKKQSLSKLLSSDELAKLNKVNWLHEFKKHNL